MEDGAAAASSKDIADRDDFMSLDITEQELQILERQAANELLNEAVPEVMRKALIDPGHSAEEMVSSLISPKIFKCSIPERILRCAERRAQSMENICGGSQALSRSSVTWLGVLVLNTETLDSLISFPLSVANLLSKNLLQYGDKFYT